MIEWLARLGYASKALIYAIVGLLAILAATNRGGRVTDTSGALRVVLTQPFGRVLLIVLAVGLCGYALWRLLDAVRDPDRHGTEFKGLVTRFGSVIRGCIYGALGVEAFKLFRGLRGSRGDETESWTARILDWPLGEIALGVVGMVIVVFGVSELIGCLRGKDDEKVEWSSIPGGWGPALRRLSRFGVGARGALIATLGVFLVRAAIQSDPSEAAGSRESMVELAGMAEGRWLLAVIAAGLLAYAIDQAVHAKFRRIRPVS
ncbi:MAG: DUF1206 domain-containing protein [Acidobacteria bacterium]|nr:DUF1206 domain-containing protein [Acidobacteriota bacterium]